MNYRLTCKNKKKLFLITLYLDDVLRMVENSRFVLWMFTHAHVGFFDDKIRSQQVIQIVSECKLNCEYYNEGKYSFFYFYHENKFEWIQE